jgi:hypothetical protein
VQGESVTKPLKSVTPRGQPSSDLGCFWNSIWEIIPRAVLTPPRLGMAPPGTSASLTPALKIESEPLEPEASREEVKAEDPTVVEPKALPGVEK